MELPQAKRIAGSIHLFPQSDVAQGDWRMVEGDSPLAAQWGLPPVRFCSRADCSSSPFGGEQQQRPGSSE